MGKGQRDTTGSVQFSAGGPEDLEALYEELRGVPGITTEAIATPIAEGDQGTMLDFLTVACSGGAITVALQIIKAVVESRGPKFSLRVSSGKDRLEVNADNIDELLPVLRELLGGS
jgi:hypothetical protein